MLRAALKRRGLALHPSKCKAQTNISTWTARGDVPIEEGFSLHVLPAGVLVELLGTVLDLGDTTKAEIDHRIAVSWRKFWASKRLLLNRGVSVIMPSFHLAIPAPTSTPILGCMNANIYLSFE